MPWDPSQYLRFGAERLRPALDLLARVPLEAPRSIADLGCGAGNVTRLLRERWPEADLLGVDRSPEMLARAAQTLPDARWARADLASWSPASPVDLLFSNATLHWLDDHSERFARLATFVRPGGCLAVQMPANHTEPTHTAAFAVAEEGAWRAKLAPLLRRAPVHALADYHRWLSPRAKALDLWETRYLHVLEGEDAVAQWTRGSFLIPLLDALEPAEREAFFARYAQRLRTAYPRRADGKALLPFRRIFLVALF
ncbi:MAG TPA: methyltransferase domain-containing protein [Myxococcales bacterium]|jgi:trans-aconitate 2-methyltransferase